MGRWLCSRYWEDGASCGFVVTFRYRSDDRQPLIIRQIDSRGLDLTSSNVCHLRMRIIKTHMGTGEAWNRG